MTSGAGDGMDVLSDVLSILRLESALFFRVDAGSPWVAEAPRGSAIAPILLAEAQHIVSYHVLLEGTCFCEMEGQAPRELEPGDIVVIPHGDRYAMSSRPGMLGSYSEADICEWFRQTLARAAPDPYNLVEGGNEPGSRRVLCGFLGCEAAPFNPVIAQLPRLLQLRSSERARGDQLGHLIELALSELREARAGRRCALLRISELLFVEVVREYASRRSGGVGCWLSGLGDPVVGRALALLHERPREPWTVDELARRTGASRSVLAERFSTLVGQPPMQYLAQWRMQLAARRLCDTQAKVSAVALEVGYDSEAAFSRAFKAIAGLPPSAWRKQRAAPRAANAKPRSG